jgi:3-oxoacyl-[acyl-carrier-protein] synthase-3
MSEERLYGVSIIGVGHYLPDNIETNEELCVGLHVSPEWIVAKTGIQRRFLAGPDDSASGFACRAARRALQMAGIDGSQLDIIIGCTFSSDYLFPPLSAKLHQELGAKGAQIFDLQANCAGLVSALTAASDRMLNDDSVHYALVVGVELCSRYVDRTDVNTAVYLSDGAGAILLGRCDPAYGIRASAFFTDSSNFESVRLRGGGSSHPIRCRNFDPAIDVMEMSGLATWKQAITHLPRVVRRSCEKSAVPLQEVDFFVFHQANLRLIEYIVQKMGVGMKRTFTNVESIGNTGSASIAIALSEAVQRGCIKPEDRVVIAGVGAGFSFGASLWRWLPHPIGDSR